MKIDYTAFLCLFFFFGALLTFFYLWKRQRLDLDEEPKHQMLNQETPNE